MSVQSLNEKFFTSCVGIRHGLSVLGVVGRDPRDDDNPVSLVSEGLVVAVGAGGAAADGSGCDRVTGAGIDEGLNLCGDLERKQKI